MRHILERPIEKMVQREIPKEISKEVPIRQWLDHNIDGWRCLSIGLLSDRVWTLRSNGAFIDLVLGYDDPVFLYNKPFMNKPSKVGNYYSKVIVIVDREKVIADRGKRRDG